MNKPFISVLLLLAALSAIGCSRSAGRNAVSGTVTLDGKPLENGAISFSPAPGEKGPSSGSSINNGEFTIAKKQGLPAGKYVVVIRTSKLSGRMLRDPETGKSYPETVSVRFREGETLEATVSDDGTNRFEFQLNTAR
ncbi:MAG: hypothetical protein JXM70_23060 [Pirellulales bacterium]|nr:hypothetical protein [Pirellulales bacterium]